MRKKMIKALTAMAVATTVLSNTMATYAAEENYTTKKGDNLSKIAKEVYGDAHNWRAIYERNKEQIKDPNLIWSNQILVMPDLGSAPGEQQISVDEQTVVAPAPENTMPPNTAADSSAFMQNVYNLMNAKNYAAMVDLDGSDAAESYVKAMTGNHTIYIPGGSLTGTGAGVYKDGNSYYFYYGDYADGVRTGHGVSFVQSYSNAYEYYEGMWSNDAPNGEGMITTVVDDGEFNIFKGNLVNGLWKGEVKITSSDIFGEIYDLSFTADNGVPTQDKTDEYLTHLVNYEYSREDIVSENRIVYAFGGHVNCVENGVEQYYDDARVSYSCAPGTHLGVFGWAD